MCNTQSMSSENQLSTGGRYLSLIITRGMDIRQIAEKEEVSEQTVIETLEYFKSINPNLYRIAMEKLA